MIEQKATENLMESSNLDGFNELKEYECHPEGFSIEDKIKNLPEWSDSETRNDKITSGFRALKNFKLAGDMINDDPTYWEKEISDVMESLKRFQTTLAEGGDKVIEDVFKLQPSMEYKKQKYTEEDDLNVSMAEIERMDALLKITNIEEKKAKLSRLQREEEYRTILTNLTSGTMTNRIKMNSEEFLRLLYETDKPDVGNLGFDQKEITGEKDVAGDAKELKKNDDADDKNLKPIGTQQKLKFVDRNIQLAKCGRGVLSLTDEEKIRIDTLLMDITDSKSEDLKKLKTEDPIKPDIYALDEESKSILSKIDQQLEVFKKEKPAETSRRALDLLESLKADEEIGKKKAGKKKSPPNRLLAINKLLNSINSIKDEEIHPLSPDHINRLIQEGNQLAAEAESKISPEVIAQLVSNAKILIPKFKYRFDED